MYLSTKVKGGKRETRRMVETSKGTLSRLILENGKPLSRNNQQEEEQRVERLAHDPGELEKQQKAEREDDKKARGLLTVIDKAFLFRYVSGQKRLIRLSFQPNPQFKPESREDRVLHSMAGTMLIDRREKRLVGLRGHMIRSVDFGGGLLGHLEKGGTFALRRTEVATNDWETTLIDVHLKGKALLFKNINEQHHEFRSRFQPVSPDLTIEQAVELLNGDPN